MPLLREQALVDALERLAKPAHMPKTEEAALLQIEVEQIAKDALKEYRDNFFTRS